MKSINSINKTTEVKLHYSEALKMIADYKSAHCEEPGFLASEYFDVEAIKRIIANPKCKGIRIFNAIKTEECKKQNRLIILGVDENGKAIINYKTNLSAVSVASLGSSIVLESTPLENGMPCPPMCQPPAITQ